MQIGCSIYYPKKHNTARKCFKATEFSRWQESNNSIKETMEGFHTCVLFYIWIILCLESREKSKASANLLTRGNKVQRLFYLAKLELISQNSLHPLVLG